MPHSRRDKPSSEKSRPCQHLGIAKDNPEKSRKSEGKNEAKSQLMISSPEATKKPPEQKPRAWSQWIPGDDGRWFYQGRLAADGTGWEYQFTEGYPSASRRPIVNNMYLSSVLQKAASNTPASSVATPNLDDGHCPSTVEIVSRDDSQYHVGEGDVKGERVPAPALETVNPAPPQGDNIGLNQQLQMVAMHPNHPTTQKKGNGGARAPDRGLSGILGRKKKLGTIVKAEKELTFNSSKRVKKWLSNVDP